MSDKIPQGGFLNWLLRVIRSATQSKIVTTVALAFFLGTIALIEKATGSHTLNAVKRLFAAEQPKAVQRQTVLAVFPNPDTSSVSKPMVDRLGFGTGEQRIPLFEDVDFERLWEGSTPEETARRVLERLKKKDVVLVVGHERSTIVEYMNHEVYENPEIATPMPLILPAATNPNLTSNMGAKRHILRLPATDAQQVTALTASIGRLNTERITIVRDKSNPLYSTYIGEQLISRLQHVQQSVGLDVDLADTGVPGDVLNADTLVVVGMENLGKVLLGYARSHRTKIGRSPRMIFTDGVAGVVFESAAMQILNEGDRVYMSGPFPTDRFKGVRLEKFPNYEPYADLARNVAYRLLAETRERGPITREAVLQTLWSWLDDGGPRTFSNTSIAFDARGDNILAQTHVFEITTQGTFHSKICSCKLE